MRNILWGKSWRGQLGCVAQALLLFFAILPTLAAASSESPRVKMVFDGDTIQLEGGEKVRYLGIDAPEMDHAGGGSEFMAVEALNLNRELLRNARIRLQYDEEQRDTHGRLLAYVFLDTGEMINSILVRKGMARVLLKKPNLRYKDMLLDSQRAAIREKCGIWSVHAKDDESFYVGNRGSFRLHRPGCLLGKQVAPRNRVIFGGKLDAYREGYSPCKRCLP